MKTCTENGILCSGRTINWMELDAIGQVWGWIAVSGHILKARHAIERTVKQTGCLALCDGEMERGFYTCLFLFYFSVQLTLPLRYRKLPPSGNQRSRKSSWTADADLCLDCVAVRLKYAVFQCFRVVEVKISAQQTSMINRASMRFLLTLVFIDSTNAANFASNQADI